MSAPAAISVAPGAPRMAEATSASGRADSPSAGTIYPRLAKLEEEGLVSKSVDGRKTVYAITAAGHAEGHRAGDAGDRRVESGGRRGRRQPDRAEVTNNVW